MKKLILLLIVLIAANVGAFVTGIDLDSSRAEADIWNNNPLDILNNPAKLGYFQNFGYGFSLSHPYKEKEFLKDSYLLYSYAAYGNNGIGLLFPLTGVINNLGEQSASDAEGNIIDTFETYAKGATIGLGINILEFTSKLLGNEFGNSYPEFDVSIGYSYTYYFYHAMNGKSTSYFDDLGFILRYTPLSSDNGGQIDCDITTSFNLFNPSKTKIDIQDTTGASEEIDNNLPYAKQFSTAFKISSKLNPNSKFIKFSDNTFSVITNLDFSKYNYESDYSKSYGMELILLDMFSLGINNKSYGSGYINISDNSYKFGLNLGLKKYFKFHINYVKHPYSIYFPELWEFSLTLNLVNIINHFQE